MIKIRMVVRPCEVDGQYVAGDPMVEEPQKQGLTGFSGDNQDELTELHCKKPYTAAKTLRNHMKSQTHTEQLFPCPLCPKI